MKKTIKILFCFLFTFILFSIGHKVEANSIQSISMDIFIDDSFTNCKSIAENSNAKVYIMTSRVNGNFNHEKITRVYSWPEVYSLIES